jgi:hypothetical protein
VQDSADFRQRFLKALLTPWQLGCVDDDGRPLEEHVDPIYASLHSDEQPCPYRDARFGKLMNVSALRQVHQHWDWLSVQIAAQCPAGSTVYQAWSASLLGVTAPLLWICQSPEEPLPSGWAALYKTCVGFSAAFCTMMLHHSMTNEILAESCSSKDFFQLLDQNGWLTGTSQVCAGSRGQIEQLYQAFSGQSQLKVARESRVLSLPNYHLSWAVESVRLQLALMAATYRHQLDGFQREEILTPSLGAYLLRESASPWCLALNLQPPRNPEIAESLVPAGQQDSKLTEFIARDEAGLTLVEREALFWELLKR